MNSTHRNVMQAAPDEYEVVNFVIFNSSRCLAKLAAEHFHVSPEEIVRRGIEASVLGRDPDRGFDAAKDNIIKICVWGLGTFYALTETKIDWAGIKYDNVFFELAKAWYELKRILRANHRIRLDDGRLRTWQILNQMPASARSCLTATESVRFFQYIPQKHTLGYLLIFPPQPMLSFLCRLLDDNAEILKPRCGDGNADGLAIERAKILDLDFIDCFRANIHLHGSYGDESKGTQNRRAVAGNEPSCPASEKAQDARGGPGRDAGRARPGRQV